MENEIWFVIVIVFTTILSYNFGKGQGRRIKHNSITKVKIEIIDILINAIPQMKRNDLILLKGELKKSLKKV